MYALQIDPTSPSAAAIFSASSPRTRHTILSGYCTSVCRAKGDLAEKISKAEGLVGSVCKAYIGFKARTYTKDGIRHSITDINCWKLETASTDDLPF